MYGKHERKRGKTTKMPEKLLNIKQVAEYLGVSTRTVQSYANEEDPELRLNGVLLGNRWRFEEKDVKDFIERRRKRGQRKTKEAAP
jgi:excisionase family DNA binding protein